MDTSIPPWAYAAAAALLFAALQVLGSREMKRADDHRESTDKGLKALSEDCRAKDEERRKRLHELSDHIAKTDTRVSVLETIITERKP